MSWVQAIKDALPEYAKDVKLNVDSFTRTTLPQEEVEGLVLSSAIATGNGKLVSWLMGFNFAEATPAAAAATIMAQNNVWYPYIEMADDENLKGLPAQLRMNVIASHGGTTKARFESYSLAASIIGKCHFCVKAHYETLKKEGYTVEQLRDIGRIAAIMKSVAGVLIN